MDKLLLFIGVVLLVCSLLKKLSGRVGVPSLLLFIVLGMLMGSDGIFKIAFDDYEIARDVATLALIFIMFTGGFETNLRSARPIISKAVLLSSVGTILTALLTGVFAHFFLGMTLLEGLLCGAVLASTDAASVFSILRSRKLALKEDTAPLLEVESGSNDPFAYMLTVVILVAMGSSVSVGDIAAVLFGQLFFGLAFGFGIGLIAKVIMQNYRFDTSGIESIFILAVILASYAGCSLLSGNGFLAVYIIGIILGNAKLKENVVLVPFFDGITTNMQAILFFLLGILSFPSRMLDVFWVAIAIMIFMTLIARPAVVFLLLAPFGGSKAQKILVSFSGLRGAASIVFAIQAVLDPAYLDHDIFHIVFIVVLLSITLQGTLLPYVARRLKMIDEEDDVIRTFTDYVEEKPVNYIEFAIAEGHAYEGKMIKDITLPPSSLIVNIKRADKDIIPNGDTVLLKDDRVMFSALKRADDDFTLKEKVITKDDIKSGNKIKDIARDNCLIVMIQRMDKYIVPDGDTVLEIGDKIFINHE